MPAGRLALSQTVRRNFLSRLGMLITGAAAFPLLPVKRAFSQSAVQEVGDPQSCDYWRYCALSEFLCTCCGGSNTSCPPGSQPSPIAWVGTCHNPADGRDYLMSYNDCCGKTECNRCECHNTEGDRPLYFNSNSNTVYWCLVQKIPAITAQFRWCWERPINPVMAMRFWTAVILLTVSLPSFAALQASNPRSNTCFTAAVVIWSMAQATIRMFRLCMMN